jgi:hypothetical protein
MKKLLDFVVKWWSYFFVKELILNTNTNEVHDTTKSKHNCMLHLMADHNKKYITRHQFAGLFRNDKVNGCKWCMPEHDKANWM